MDFFRKFSHAFPLFFLFLSAYAQEITFDEGQGCFDKDRANTLVLISHTFPDAFCSGTIINAAFILTAAHCASRKQLYVYPGLAFEYIAMMKEEEANGSKVVDQRIHPKYDRKTLAYDIAVFEVEPRISLDSEYTGVVFNAWLPSIDMGEDIREYAECTKDSYVMGWTNFVVNTTSAVAMCTRSKIMAMDDCQHSYGMYDVTDRICVKKKSDLCLNAGGAVMCNGQQVGVISYVHCEIETIRNKKITAKLALLPVFGWIVKISTVVNAISSVVTVVRKGVDYIISSKRGNFKLIKQMIYIKSMDNSMQMDIRDLTLK
ncbi:unnamed protein product [Acanthoscelides obtectus]|uniref:Peptidase S1 domain-containing protein n=1 Tax=Acanthoscelides obtectus TaxID=200917 RepID=A0A9P0PV77_ACAOB|nr:unnamed protein product [Acanthoscelides obtectus]CAK1659659.1 Trypsin-1 [Acanthoscelides obtectus]